MEIPDSILDECLEQLASGASTLDECLARHPAHAASLRPLLLAAQGLTDLRDVRPSPAFKARARANLTLHMQAHPHRKAASPFFLRLAFSMAALVMAFLTTGTALAQNALPGDLLYNWKLTSEEIWRANASDSLAADLFLADRRVDEMLAVAGDADAYAIALNGYLEVLARFAVYTDAESQARILPVLTSQREIFVSAGISVPELEAVIESDMDLGTPTPLPDPLPVLPTPVPTGLPTLIPTPISTLIPTIDVPTLPVPTLPLPLP